MTALTAWLSLEPSYLVHRANYAAVDSNTENLLAKWQISSGPPGPKFENCVRSGLLLSDFMVEGYHSL